MNFKIEFKSKCNQPCAKRKKKVLFGFRSSIDGEQSEQQQQPINDIFMSSNSSFIRKLNDRKRTEPYVLCQIFADGQSLCIPVQTSFKSFTNRWR